MKSTESARRRSTEELSTLVQEAEQLNEVFAACPEEFKALGFPQILAAHLEAKGLGAVELGERALLSKSFTYQLLSGDRVPGRDIVLRLALALGLTVEETQAMLRAACRGALYPRVPRDAVILNALSRHLSLTDTAELLTARGEVPLV